MRTLERNDPPVYRNDLGLLVSEAEQEVEAIELGMSLLADGEAVYREWRRIVTHYDILGVQVHDATTNSPKLSRPMK